MYFLIKNCLENTKKTYFRNHYLKKNLIKINIFVANKEKKSPANLKHKYINHGKRFWRIVVVYKMGVTTHLLLVTRFVDL